MPKKIIAVQNQYQITYDDLAKNITLTNKLNPHTPLLTAKFSYDTADGASILSDFTSAKDQKGLVKMTTDMISDYLSGDKDRCKLFCYPGKHYENDFKDSKDYRVNNIDRLMLRDKPTDPLKPTVALKDISIVILNNPNISAAYLTQMTLLLKHHTYWASDVNEEYTAKALQHSTCILALDQNNKIIGFVRFISNNSFAYISDMVVHSNYRKKKIGTALMEQACITIDKTHTFSALISAKEGDGFAAAAKLYGTKCGFVDYEKMHQQTIYFRYIRATLENQTKLRALLNLNTMDVKSYDSKGSISSLYQANSNILFNPSRNNFILNNIKNMSDTKAAVNISVLNRSLHATIPNLTTQSLFKENYTKVTHETPQYILASEKITASTVRAGNLLILEALNKISTGNLGMADKLIYRAMYRYGNSAAMRFVKMFYSLPGRIANQQVTDIDRLIEIYEPAESRALNTEAINYLTTKKDEMQINLQSALRGFRLTVTESLQAYQPSYSSYFAGTYHNKLSAIQNCNMFDVHLPPLTLTHFDANGFIGAALPKKDAWYLTTQSQKDFEALERSIDLSKNDQKEVTPALYLKK